MEMGYVAMYEMKRTCFMIRWTIVILEYFRVHVSIDHAPYTK